MDIALLVMFAGTLLMISVLLFFAVLVVAIKREDKGHLPDRAASPTGAMSRRVLGTYAHRSHRVTRAEVRI
ncbi:hypothetical protein ACIBQX_00605 [Nonomuraea sp. NPDC049714]|uniref:hypothetical protein n=1 Tax=Nonomuraea sp. NPDC049714 TaxID=3364357 RepID=UPI00378869E6